MLDLTHGINRALLAFTWVVMVWGLFGALISEIED
jgi:hypothetical protein